MVVEILHDLMNKKDLTLQQLSDMSDVPIDTIKNIYYGKVKDPKASTVLQLSMALNVTMNYLMGVGGLLEEEKEIIKRYRTCGTHGKSMISLVSRFEATSAVAERQQSCTHRVPCLIPIGKVKDGIIYNSCNIKEIETSLDDVCLAIEITTNYFVPSYCKGDCVLINNRFPEHQEHAVFADGKRCYFRKYLEVDDGYILSCLNGIGNDMFLKRMDEIECIGTCVGVVRA